MRGMGGVPRLLVIDDNSDFRAVVAIALGREGYEVAAAADANEALRVIDTFHPDLAVVDVDLGNGVDGFWVGRNVQRTSDLPIIYLTANDSTDARLAGFGAGADDFVPKAAPLAELVARVHAVLRRSARLTSRVAVAGDLVVDEMAHTVQLAGSEVELTPVQFRILGVLVRRVGQVVPKRALLQEVWGFDAFDPNLVEVHMSALRRKLEDKGPRLVHTVRGAGYVLRAE